MTKILNVAGYAIDLDDGRTLAPGETAEVDSDQPHNKSLLDRGAALVLEDDKPKGRLKDTPDDQNREDKNS